VLIGEVGSPYTITNSGSITIDSLRLHAPGATLQHSGGPFTVAAGSLSIGPQSTFRTENTGTLATSGDVIITGGQLQSFSNLNLPPGANLNVTDGGFAQLSNAQLTDATLSVTNAASIDFNAVILGGSGGARAIGDGTATNVRLNFAHVGDAGIGTMSLRNGVHVEASTSIGTRVVVGINGGTGELNISGGAQVRAVHLMAGTDRGVPQYTPGTGTILISGADTRVTVPGWMVVGPPSGGSGTLIMDGGTLTVGGLFPSFKIINPSGTMLVRGGVFETSAGWNSSPKGRLVRAPSARRTSKSTVEASRSSMDGLSPTILGSASRMGARFRLAPSWAPPAPDQSCMTTAGTSTRRAWSSPRADAWSSRRAARRSCSFDRC
jgi:T5SS/PEP-CTERM-associated repeat protein